MEKIYSGLIEDYEPSTMTETPTRESPWKKMSKKLRSGKTKSSGSASNKKNPSRRDRERKQPVLAFYFIYLFTSFSKFTYVFEYVKIILFI